MRLGYNTNGFPHHELADTCALLAELGYDAVAVTPDVFHLNPFVDGVRKARELAPELRRLGLAVAVETGARFLFDPRRKHQPTLLSDEAGAAHRLDGLRRCLDIAAELGAETFSFWSGSPERPAPRDVLLDRLCRGAEALLDAARGTEVTVCFEPEPGMLVASLTELDEFLSRLDRDDLRVMLDVGHVPVTETVTAAGAVRSLAPRLGGLQLDDSRDGRHEHLFPGEGEIDFTEVLRACADVGFDGLACLELPRHAHDPVQTARRALELLRSLERSGSS